MMDRKGTGNLPTGGRAKTGSFALALRGDAQFGDLALHDDRPGPMCPIVGCRHGVAGTVGKVGDRIVDQDEALEGAGRM